MSGAAVRAVLTLAGLLFTTAPNAHGRLPVFAAAEERSIWGWQYSATAGSGPTSPPPGAGGAPGPDPSPEGAGEASGPGESEDSSSGAFEGPPSPPPPDPPSPSAERTWHEGWGFAPNALGFWRAGYLGWMFTPLGFFWRTSKPKVAL